ncbi:ABC transporter permease [Ammoniphilus sp. CFH 90114]|uniref:ABC transporter permease n=1 Tax=Ammoniphilus sp. CFH 90114 TaxID=2493665 RepID=UPI00100F5EEC|nr:ABC transporter permease [Ammoniphilus sp. CFH 90114]RXT15286.1 ABC transporter permease [Ammoniphilus sp. CFH 90114]
MKPSFKIGDIIQEEWLHIFKDKRLIGILFIIPIFYTALFGYLYSNHQVTNIKTVIFDGDQTEFSRKIIQGFAESEAFEIIGQAYGEPEVNQWIERGEAKVGVIIPPDFSARIKHGENVPILTMIDGSNMLFSNTATRAANHIVSTFSYGVSANKLSQQGWHEEQVHSTFQSIPFRTRILYNPTFNYSHFLLFGLMGAILQQVLLLGIALTVTREKEKGTWGRYSEWRTAPWKVAYAKTAPYFLIGIFNHLTVLGLGLYLFQLPFRGTLFSVLALSVCFVFALSGIGYLASLFSPNQVQATQTTMLIAVPSFLLSGFSWPFDAMPDALVIAGHGLPLTYFLDGVREIFIKGHGFGMIQQDCLVLLLMGFICYFAAWLITPMQFKHKVRGEENIFPGTSS